MNTIIYLAFSPTSRFLYSVLPSVISACAFVSFTYSGCETVNDANGNECLSVMGNRVLTSDEVTALGSKISSYLISQ